jgi:hypothetical protein
VIIFRYNFRLFSLSFHFVSRLTFCQLWAEDFSSLSAVLSLNFHRFKKEL